MSLISPVISNCFPEMNLDRKRPKYALFHGYWKSVTNQRVFMDKIASQLGNRKVLCCGKLIIQDYRTFC